MSVAPVFSLGSSPRIRGECATAGGGAFPDGIIPANTGRILIVFLCFVRCRDHPREYGENLARVSACEDVYGSSPRIRGEYWVVRLGMWVRGIIPANTGRITPTVSASEPLPDHPREYGENGEFHLHPSGRGGIIPANTGRIVTVPFGG